MNLCDSLILLSIAHSSATLWRLGNVYESTLLRAGYYSRFLETQPPTRVLLTRASQAFPRYYRNILPRQTKSLFLPATPAKQEDVVVAGARPWQRQPRHQKYLLGKDSIVDSGSRWFL